MPTNFYPRNVGWDSHLACYATENNTYLLPIVDVRECWHIPLPRIYQQRHLGGWITSFMFWLKIRFNTFT